VTLTFDPAIRHIVLQQSSTSTYIPTFIQIEETFCGRTDGRADIFPLYTIRSTFGSGPNNKHDNVYGAVIYLSDQPNPPTCCNKRGGLSPRGFLRRAFAPSPPSLASWRSISVSYWWHSASTYNLLYNSTNIGSVYLLFFIS